VVKQPQRQSQEFCSEAQNMTIAFRDAVPLRRADLGRVRGSVSIPSYDVTRLTPAVVHLGVGAFHRGTRRSTSTARRVGRDGRGQPGAVQRTGPHGFSSDGGREA
jgi:hypothetical protein